MSYLLEMIDITKTFGEVVANDSINLRVKKGEIHVLVGENGSGKSTLMKILNGLYPLDKGRIEFQGRKVNIDSPGTAVRLGIGMVYQHFMLVKPLTVTENMILGVEPKKNGLLDMERARKEIGKVSEKYDLKIDTDAKINQLSVGMQQRVEILKVLFKGAELLVFDEPSAVLTPQEVKELYKIMKNLIREGKTIIFITHKLQEVVDISDKVTVLRKGKVVKEMLTQDATKEKIASAMVGRDFLFEIEKTSVEIGKPVLEIQNLSVLSDKKIQIINDISFNIRQGEIVGIAGVNGNGQTELVEALTGLRKSESGSILLLRTKNQKEEVIDITHATPRQRILAGIAHIPEDRNNRATVMEFNVSENLALGVHREKYRSGINLNYHLLNQDSEKILEKYDIRPRDIHTVFANLSGGNQQKVVVARELEKPHTLLIAAQPTRGVDIGAIESIHNMILKEKEKGRAILLVSSEISEIMQISDRIIVMYEGRINGVLARSEADEEKLGILMLGRQEVTAKS